MQRCPVGRTFKRGECMARLDVRAYRAEASVSRRAKSAPCVVTASPWKLRWQRRPTSPSVSCSCLKIHPSVSMCWGSCCMGAREGSAGLDAGGWGVSRRANARTWELREEGVGVPGSEAPQHQKTHFQAGQLTHPQELFLLRFRECLGRAHSWGMGCVRSQIQKYVGQIRRRRCGVSEHVCAAWITCLQHPPGGPTPASAPLKL